MNLASDREAHARESWPARLTEGNEPGDEWATIEDAARWELVCLWGDLERAIAEAHRGGWSVGCSGLATRIRGLMVLVGPAPWYQVGFTLLDSGVYQRLHVEWDIPAEVDEVEFERFRQVMRADAARASASLKGTSR